ncbi:MAG: universal stress protein [Balneolaceae bacterium]|nr:universal stress protein [Balneolaceae bacterium]
MDVKRILVPTDFSEESKMALVFADIFIELFDCKVDVMHVIPLSDYLSDSFSSIGMPINMDDDVYPKLIEQKKEELQKFADEHIKNKKNKGNSIVKIDRKPSDAIAERASKEEYDLILMSATGSHKSSLFHGSITDKIIRKSLVPVLTIPESITGKDILKILVPCDFSHHSMSALPIAFEIADKFDAGIEVVHVIELFASDIHGVEPNTSGLAKKNVYESLVNEIARFLEEYPGKRLRIKRGDVDYFDEMVCEENGEETSVMFKVVITKSVTSHHEIIEYANNESDLVVMSTHGRTGLSHMLLGSTAEQVIKQVKKPQLTIKPDLDN